MAQSRAFIILKLYFEVLEQPIFLWSDCFFLPKYKLQNSNNPSLLTIVQTLMAKPYLSNAARTLLIFSSPLIMVCVFCVAAHLNLFDWLDVIFPDGREAFAAAFTVAPGYAMLWFSKADTQRRLLEFIAFSAIAVLMFMWIRYIVLLMSCYVLRLECL